MTDKELENMAREAAVAIGRDMKTNKFVTGETQLILLRHTEAS